MDEDLQRLRRACRRAGEPLGVQISKEMEKTLEDIKEFLTSRMHRYDYWDNGADYVCDYCYARPRTNHDDINHDINCPGHKYLETLINITSQLEEEGGPEPERTDPSPAQQP